MSQKADSKLQGHAWIQEDSFARQIIERSWDLYCQFDIHANLTYASDRFLDWVGFIPEEFQQIARFIDSEYRVDVQKLFIHTLQTQVSSKIEFRARSLVDNVIWFECLAIPICDSEGDLVQICVGLTDITQRKNQESRLVAMAYHDPLTGLPNRRLFKEHLQQSLLQAKRTLRPFALMIVDIDDFKIINDTMGHDVGDAFLQAFVRRIQGCLREEDMFARIGGDEFMILLPAVDCDENVKGVAQRIIQSVDQIWDVLGYQFHATVSMGITMFRADLMEASQMMKEVDIALYQVKGKGRNHYRFYHPVP
ncbi:GGDEF domain-containing protein [Paenibacillus oryzisoli]|uniref:diguanylate cyclase domain-containing protein n=1 Tax=Paenibacillus oryzisoli TaxID=1850517 RepID=UPI003D274D22